MSDTNFIIDIIFAYCIKAGLRNDFFHTFTIVIFKIYVMGIKILEYTVFSMGGC